MDRFNRESNEAEKGVTIVLDKEKHRNKFWGRPQAVAAAEYIKVFSIIKHIEKKRISTEKEIREEAEDLFKEFNVTGFDYTDIFTDKVIDQVINSNKIDSISVGFNNAVATIDRNSTVESVTNAWKENWRKVNGIDSPEAIEKWKIEQTNRKEVSQQEQTIINRMLSRLDAFDFSDQEKTIDWLYEYYTHYNDGADMHDDEVIQKFEVHGYTPENNNGVDGMLGETLKDKERLGKVIIGYLLMNGSLALRDDWLKNSIEDWKKL